MNDTQSKTEKQLESLADMKLWSKEMREQHYIAFYSALLSHEDGNKQQEEWYFNYLLQLKEFWNMSDNDVRVLESRVLRTRAWALQWWELHQYDDADPPPRQPTLQ